MIAFQSLIYVLKNGILLIGFDWIPRDNMANAAEVARAITTHIKECREDMKLPALYLLDSITKSVGGKYSHRKRNHVHFF